MVVCYIDENVLPSQKRKKKKIVSADFIKKMAIIWSNVCPEVNCFNVVCQLGMIHLSVEFNQSLNLHATYLCSSFKAVKSQTLVKNKGLLPVSKPKGIPWLASKQAQ